jgi:hypothetical protein
MAASARTPATEVITLFACHTHTAGLGTLVSFVPTGRPD